MNEYLSKIKDASIPIIEKHKKELVSVSLRKEFGTNIISITIDDPVTFSSDIDEIASINQEILDIVNDDIPDGYYLEVTTPGVERELKENEYEKSIGKYICVKTYQKEFDDMCGEHFKLKVEEGKIVIYQINKEGNQSIYEKTNISSEYLTQTDLISIENGGLDVYGKEELNKIIEDFE